MDPGGIWRGGIQRAEEVIFQRPAGQTTEGGEMEVCNYNDFLKTLWGSGLLSGFVVSGLLSVCVWGGVLGRGDG